MGWSRPRGDPAAFWECLERREEGAGSKLSWGTAGGQAGNTSHSFGAWELQDGPWEEIFQQRVVQRGQRLPGGLGESPALGVCKAWGGKTRLGLVTDLLWVGDWARDLQRSLFPDSMKLFTQPHPSATAFPWSHTHPLHRAWMGNYSSFQCNSFKILLVFRGLFFLFACLSLQTWIYLCF